MTEEKGLIINEMDLLNMLDVPTFCERVNSHWSSQTERTIISEFNNSLDETIEVNSHLEESISKVIITIPAFNEEKTIGNVVKDIINVMNHTRFNNNYLVLVVNDGSNDNTIEEASEAGAYVYSHKQNQGLAETFRTEMKLCLKLGADIIVHTDADGQYKAKQIPLLLEEINNGTDLVLGSRFLGTIEDMPLLKKFGNRAFSIVLSGLVWKKISDSQTGFRAFTKLVAKEVPITSTHTYTQEQIIRASKMKIGIKEVPIYFAKRTDGESRLMKNPLEYAFKAWKNILRIYFSKN